MVKLAMIVRRGVCRRREAAGGVPMTRVYCMSFSTAAKVLTVVSAPSDATWGCHRLSMGSICSARCDNREFVVSAMMNRSLIRPAVVQTTLVRGG